ncbi:hypothetical protein [Gymnodinialimonas ulvae]|uniref:hypothetical protein n=1 Tax=Gymnodinialimonas ulvae TaxID=3126504 RepID=UPI0030AAC57C
MYRASPDQFGGIPLQDRGAWLAATPDQTEPVELTEGFWPRLVTFADLHAPSTITTVDPGNLAETFGQGVRLVSITLEITDEPRTSGIVEPLLQWLPNHYGRMLDGARYRHICAENRLANDLSAGAFSTEVVPSENPPPPIAFTLDCLDRREHDDRPNHSGPPDPP